MDRGTKKRPRRWRFKRWLRAVWRRMRWPRRFRFLRFLRLAWKVVVYRYFEPEDQKEERVGLPVFRQQYTTDYIVEYAAEESTRLPDFAGCINCGLCLARCPAVRALTTSRKAGDRYPGPRDVATSLSRSVPEFWATTDVIYYCTMCGACEAVCPVSIPIPEIVTMMRGKILRQRADLVPQAHVYIPRNLAQKGNVYGVNLEAFDEFRQERAEYVFFAGCVYSRVERESITATMRLFRRLGVSFTTVDEACCGGPVDVIGAPWVESVAEHNLRQFQTAGTDKLIVACPRCYLTFTRGEPYRGKLEVVYTTELLASCDLQLAIYDSQQRITYHDPCEIGRARGEYETARVVLRRIGNFVEMSHSREMSDCCGAGGGVRGAFARTSIRMARRRFEEAQDVDAGVLLTECPSCLHNFRNARRSRDSMEVCGLSEYVSRLAAE